MYKLHSLIDITRAYYVMPEFRKVPIFHLRSHGRLLSKARERSQPSLHAGVDSFIGVLRKRTDVMQLAGRRSRLNYP